jgi:hypothetical protein
MENNPKITIKIVETIFCPVCNAPELAPPHTHWVEGAKFVIRAYKVELDGHWWSQCLRCSGAWNHDLTVYTPANHNPKKGWF